MEKEYFADIVINKEKLSNNEDIFVVKCTNIGITSQGKSQEEAIELYLKEKPEDYDLLRKAENLSIFSFIEIKKPFQNA